MKKSTHHQYSKCDARSVKLAHFLKQMEIDSPKVMVLLHMKVRGGEMYVIDV